MTEFISLSCPSCGARLQIQMDLGRFMCRHCHHELELKRVGDAIYLKLLRTSAFSDEKKCHRCGAVPKIRKADILTGKIISDLDNSTSIIEIETPEIHRCQKCGKWTCFNCTSTSDGAGWECKSCTPD
jgi:predicted RNA-binding Zn-ribbon protein involved in translation (DUF1610 family)